MWHRIWNQVPSAEKQQIKLVLYYKWFKRHFPKIDKDDFNILYKTYIRLGMLKSFFFWYSILGTKNSFFSISVFLYYLPNFDTPLYNLRSNWSALYTKTDVFWDESMPLRTVVTICMNILLKQTKKYKHVVKSRIAVIKCQLPQQNQKKTNRHY